MVQFADAGAFIEHAVNVRVVTSDAEKSDCGQHQTPERQAAEMAAGIVDAMRDAQIDNVRGITRRKDTPQSEDNYGRPVYVNDGDCVERIKEFRRLGRMSISPAARRCTNSASDRDHRQLKDHKEFFKTSGYLILNCCA